jgi:hypothetical protein
MSSVLDSFAIQATTRYVDLPFISGAIKMSKQRRQRLNRNKHIRSHRSFIRNGVE